MASTLLMIIFCNPFVEGVPGTITPKRDTSKSARVVCFVQVLSLPILPTAFCMVAPFQLTNKSRAARDNNICRPWRHAFGFLPCCLVVGALAFVARVDGKPAPCVWVLPTQACKKSNLLGALWWAVAPVCLVAIHFKPRLEFHRRSCCSRVSDKNHLRACGTSRFLAWSARHKWTYKIDGNRLVACHTLLVDYARH